MICSGEADLRYKCCSAVTTAVVADKFDGLPGWMVGNRE
jgi:hypothetical protein